MSNSGTNTQATDGHVSVARVLRAWYVICESEALTDRPLSRKLYGKPLVVFRGAGGKAGVLLDRCAHRNIPLSLGAVTDGNLQCGYHGWQFDTGGTCRKVPGLCGKVELPSRAVESHHVREQDG